MTSGPRLHVSPLHHAAARAELEAMDAEEQERRSASVAVPEAEGSRLAPVGGVLSALLLVGFYIVTGPQCDALVLVRRRQLRCLTGPIA